jgi:CRP/FNR family nitrogen fixation transcriptional regulator
MLRERASAPRRHPPVIDLAMQRQDIADYLGLTIETVSRTFTHMKERGLIALPTTRRVEILRLDLLGRLAAADRDAPIWDRKFYANSGSSPS